MNNVFNFRSYSIKIGDDNAHNIVWFNYQVVAVEILKGQRVVVVAISKPATLPLSMRNPAEPSVVAVTIRSKKLVCTRNFTLFL